MRDRHLKILTLSTILLSVIFLNGCKKSLHDAVQYSHISIIERLIKSGADVNARDSWGKTPLHIAAMIGREDAAKLLIANGADIDAKDNYGYTPLHDAAGNSRWANRVARLLISAGADIHARTIGGVSPLHRAAEGGDPNIVKLLIEKGADVNAVDQYDNTPLHWAVRAGTYGQEDTVKLLLAAGAKAKVLVRDKSGFNPLEEALIRENQTIANLLVESIDLKARADSNDTLLHHAIRRYDVKMVKILIEHGADIDAKDGQGNTPLDVAIKYIHNKEIIDLLIAKGAHKTEGQEPKKIPTISQDEFLQNLKKAVAEGQDINQGDAGGRTPLHEASILGYEDSVKFLLVKGANPRVADKMGFTALHFAVMHSHLEVAKVLIEHGADVNAKDNENKFTPLHFAVMAHSRNLELAELLIRNGADLSAAGPLGGQTPLHMAVAAGNMSLTTLFIAKGADVNVRNESGATPLHEAARRGYKEIVEFLIEKGAQINAKDEDGMTPLAEALLNDPKAREVVEILQKHGAKTYGWKRVK
jgi:ankyrin repeat protein